MIIYTAIESKSNDGLKRSYSGRRITFLDVFFVDAETNGLYGSFLSIASIVLDDDGNEKDCFYGTIKEPEKQISSEWVKNNVLPFLDIPVRSLNDYYENEHDMIESFYSFYQKFPDSIVIADVPYPVESRLFIKAVNNNITDREFKAPFPLMDLSSILYAKGYHPLIERRSLVDCDDLTLHNALDDVRMTIRIWKKSMGRT